MVNKNQAIFRESTNTYQIYYGSSIHLHSKVEERAKYLSNSELQRALDKSFPLRPVYANAYNAEYYTSRFYTRKFIFETTLEDAVQFYVEEKEKTYKKANLSKEEMKLGIHKFLSELLQTEKIIGSAGIILYYLGDRDSLICKTISTLIREETFGKSFVLISSRESFYHLDLFRRYEAVQLLKEDPELLSVDQRVSEDIKIYLSDLSEKIEELLKSHFHLESSKIETHSSYSIPQFVSLSLLVSGLIKDRFPHCPKINCEFVVREHLSPVIRNTRKKLIRSLLIGEKTQANKENGYGPDVAIFRSMFVAKNVFVENEGSLAFNFSNPTDFKGNPDGGMKKMYDEIVNTLESQPKDLSALYKVLTTEPYGIYSEVIPLYLLAILLEKKYAFSLYEEGRYEKEITSDVWERLHLHPENFRIQIVKTTGLIEKYSESLIDIFSTSRLTAVEETYGSREKNKISENKIYRSVYLLLKWYTRLPEYTRKTHNLSKESSQFLSFIVNSSDPEITILEEIPMLLGLSFDSSTSEILEKSLQTLRNIRFEIESAYSKLIFEMSKSSQKALLPYISQTSASLQEDIQTLLKEKSYSIEILKNQEPNFKKLYDRLTLSYTSEEALLESIGSLLSDIHPRSWKDDTLRQFEFRLASELSKISVASQIGMTVETKMDKIVDEFKSLGKRERELVLERLRKGLGQG